MILKEWKERRYRAYLEDIEIARKEITDALLIDCEDVRINGMNFPDMELTVDGVRICRETLGCYVLMDIIADALEVLTEEKTERR